MTQVFEVEVSRVIMADWNYKKPATQEQKEHIARSIKADSSYGVLAVREIPSSNGDIVYEVIDGNHRFEAVVEVLNWTKVKVENFGRISKAKAVTIARRRNHKWFEDDTLQLAKLYASEVVPEIGIEELVLTGPDTQEEILNLINLANFKWEDPSPKDMPNGDNTEDQTTKVEFKLHEEALNAWIKFKERVEEETGIKKNEMIFEIMITYSLGMPDDLLRQEAMDMQSNE